MPDPILSDSRCVLAASTPSDAQHYFGFHDVSPWDPTDNRLALLRVPADLRHTPTAQDRAEICLWDPARGKPEPVGETRAFNWQQGSRLQWLPGPRPRLITNTIEDRVPAARILDLDSGRWGDPIPAIYSISRTGDFALAPDFPNLARHWRDYSYDLPGGSACPPGKEGSLLRVDLVTGESRVLVEVAQARALCGQEHTGAEGHDFISHVTFSPTGKRICFLYRRFASDGALFSFLLSARPDGSELAVLAREKCSHFDWFDDDRILLWTRKLPGRAAALRGSGITRRFPFKQVVAMIRKLNPKLKQSLFAEMYYLLDSRNPGSSEAVGQGILEQDGHPMFAPDRRWMVTDTYAFEGFQPLILFSMDSRTRHDIVSFPVHENFKQPALKCDLHPRWNRAGTKIAVDSAHSGMRQLYVVDASSFLTNSAR